MADTTEQDSRLLSQGIRTPSDRLEVVAVPGDLQSSSSDGLSTACPARVVDEVAIAKNPEGDSSRGFLKPGPTSSGEADGSRTRRVGSRSRSRSLSGGEKGKGTRFEEKRGSAPSLGSCSVVLTRPRLALGVGVSGAESVPSASSWRTGLEETWEGESLRVSQLLSSTPAARTNEGTPEVDFNPADCLPPQAYVDTPAVGVCSVRDSSASERASVVEISDEEEAAPDAGTQERRGSTASTGSRRGRGRHPGPNYDDPKVKAIREKRTPAPTRLSRNLENLSDAECMSYAEKLEKRAIQYDPRKDYSDMAELGLLSYQKDRIEEETRAYPAMSAQELAGSIQRLLVDANEARRVGTAHINGGLSGRILLGIGCALVGVSQLASRVPANEETKSLKKTVDALVRVNVDLRKRLEQLEARDVRPAPAPATDEGRKRPRPKSSPEEAGGEKNAGTQRRRRVARIASSSSSTLEERMEVDEMPPKPQRTASECPGPARADFLKSREVPPAQEVLTFDDTAIRAAEAAKKLKGRKKKKKNPGRGEMELFSPTLPELPPPVSREDPPAPTGYRPGAANRAAVQDRTEEWEGLREMARFNRTPAEEYFPPLPRPRHEPPFEVGRKALTGEHAVVPAKTGAPLTKNQR